MKTNDIIKGMFRMIEEANQVEEFIPGFRTLTIKKDVEDFRFRVSGRIENTYQGNEIQSRYSDMRFLITILHCPTNGEINGVAGGIIQERTETYQN